MRQCRWVGGRHDRHIVIEPFHALRPNLETLKVTRVKGHIVNVEHGPAWFLGHALGILANLAELVRRDQNELQTIDLTHQRLERECLADAALTFEQSEGHMTPLNERGEQGPKSRHILLLTDHLIALRLPNFDGLQFPVESGFKNLVLGNRVLVPLMHERHYMPEFSAPVRRDRQSPVQPGFDASVGIAEGQDLHSLCVFEIGHLSHLADEIGHYPGIGAGNPPRRNPAIGRYPQRMLGEGVVQIDKQGLIIPEDRFDIRLVELLERSQKVFRIRL
jgi:hypothetical protein